MNKQLQDKLGHQKRENRALKDRVRRLEAKCLELQHVNAELRHANRVAFEALREGP